MSNERKSHKIRNFAAILYSISLFFMSKHIFVIGAGRSATDLIEYLLNQATIHDWYVTVGDMSLPLATEKINGHPRGTAIYFDGGNADMLQAHISQADIVVSLLPPAMHPAVAKVCLQYEKHLVTASYISAEMASLDAAAKEKGLIFLNELGADPGIDHLNVMRGLDKLKAEGAKILELRSFCGSLIAPESNDNPWGYKFTWSPMNVIVAGQGAASYLKEGKRKLIPYNRLFTTTDKIEVEGLGEFEAYANRDSYSYIETYHLEGIQTLLRGTLRQIGYCEGWDAFIRLGMTANDYKIVDANTLTYREWTESFLSLQAGESLEMALARFLDTEIDSDLMKRLLSTGILSEEKIQRENATPAEILYDLLMSRWQFLETDKDMLVMADKILYEKEGKRYEKTATMAVIGRDHEHTAISQTVGLPAAMGVKLILQGKINRTGVLMPIYPEIYQTILGELEEFGIRFSEKTIEL